VVSFLAIESQLPTNLGPDLSCDQFYLLLICKAIVLGRCSKSLSIRSPVIQRNGYFGHSECLLLAMLADNCEVVRQKAVEIIKQVRKKNKSVKVRKFVIPDFDFGASSYDKLINWKNTTEPPLLSELTTEELDQIRACPEGNETMNEIKKIPCHTQSVERAVKLVTEASQAVCGEKRRNGTIRVKLESRAKMPKFGSKQDFRI
jgi:hypothetical protein